MDDNNRGGVIDWLSDNWEHVVGALGLSAATAAAGYGTYAAIKAGIDKGNKPDEPMPPPDGETPPGEGPPGENPPGEGPPDVEIPPEEIPPDPTPPDPPSGRFGGGTTHGGYPPGPLFKKKRRKYRQRHFPLHFL